MKAWPSSGRAKWETHMKNALIAALVAVSALTAIASSADAQPYRRHGFHGHRHQVCTIRHHHRVCGWR